MKVNDGNSQHDSREENMSSLTAVFFAVVSHVRVVPGKAFLLSSLSPSNFTAMASYSLHFLPPMLPFFTFSSQHTALSLLSHQFALEASGSGWQHASVPAGSWELSLPKHLCLSEFFSSGALPESSDLHLGLGLCKERGKSPVRFYLFELKS